MQYATSSKIYLMELRPNEVPQNHKHDCLLQTHLHLLPYVSV